LDQGVNHHGIVSIRDVLWVIIAAPLHWHIRPSDVLVDLRYGGI
jgi:hypothetical protein